MDNNAESIRTKFVKQLILSEKTKNNYLRALNGGFLRNIVQNEFGKSSIFEIKKLEDLWSLYQIINPHPVNISNHRAVSAAIMKYIRFLNNGKKYGRRVDYGIPRKKRSNT